MIEHLVTGASGFIGSRLMKRLQERNEVTVPIPHKQIGVYPLEPCRRFFFLSTYGNMAHHERDANATMIANAFQPAECLIRSRAELFVYLSTSSVTLPVQTTYSSAKMIGESALTYLGGRSTCIIRPYTVIGVGEQKEHLIPTLIRSCMEGEEMDFVYDATHDFVDVADVVDGIMALSDEMATGVFEFGRGEAIDNETILFLVEQACGRSANIRNVQGGLRSYDKPDWFCRNPAPQFKPLKTVEQSIEEMVDAYKFTKASGGTVS